MINCSPFKILILIHYEVGIFKFDIFMERPLIIFNFLLSFYRFKSTKLCILIYNSFIIFIALSLVFFFICNMFVPT